MRQAPSPYGSHQQYLPASQQSPTGALRTRKSGSPTEVPYQILLIIGIAQLTGVLIFLIRYWSEISSYGGSLEGFIKFAIPFAIGDLILVAPIVLSGISESNASNPTLLAAASISGLVQFSRAAPSIFERGLTFDFYNIGMTSSASTFLPASLIAATAILALPLAILRLKPGPWMVGRTSDWWIASLGFVALLLLMFEDPRRVIGDEWSFLGFIILVAVTASGFLESRIALGAFLGTGAATLGSIVAFAGHWLLLDGDRDFRAVSYPSGLALLLSVVGVIVTRQHLPFPKKTTTDQWMAR